MTVMLGTSYKANGYNKPRSSENSVRVTHLLYETGEQNNERIRSATGVLVYHLASKRSSAYDRNTLHEHACFVQSGIKGLKYPDATVP